MIFSYEKKCPQGPTEFFSTEKSVLMDLRNFFREKNVSWDLKIVSIEFFFQLPEKNFYIFLAWTHSHIQTEAGNAFKRFCLSDFQI